MTLTAFVYAEAKPSRATVICFEWLQRPENAYLRCGGLSKT
jgi:hypothetical protein